MLEDIGDVDTKSTLLPWQNMAARVKLFNLQGRIPYAHGKKSHPLFLPFPCPYAYGARCVPESIILRVSAVAPLLEQNALRAAQTSMRGRETSPRLVVHRRRPRQAGNVLPAGGDE